MLNKELHSRFPETYNASAAPNERVLLGERRVFGEVWIRIWGCGALQLPHMPTPTNPEKLRHTLTSSGPAAAVPGPIARLPKSGEILTSEDRARAEGQNLRMGKVNAHTASVIHALIMPTLTRVVGNLEEPGTHKHGVPVRRRAWMGRARRSSLERLNGEKLRRRQVLAFCRRGE